MSLGICWFNLILLRSVSQAFLIFNPGIYLRKNSIFYCLNNILDEKLAGFVTIFSPNWYHSSEILCYVLTAILFLELYFSYSALTSALIQQILWLKLRLSLHFTVKVVPFLSTQDHRWFWCHSCQNDPEDGSLTHLPILPAHSILLCQI